MVTVYAVGSVRFHECDSVAGSVASVLGKVWCYKEKYKKGEQVLKVQWYNILRSPKDVFFFFSHPSLPRPPDSVVGATLHN